MVAWRSFGFDTTVGVDGPPPVPFARVSAVGFARHTGPRIALAAAFVLVAVLASAPAALAADGIGLGGRTTDKSVTFFCFGVIALFIVLPIVLTLIQSRLDSRKDRIREQLERVHRP